ncbi:MAG: hypothetical protein CM15mP62_10390 [Rhodospirillaceae bacterium]|nr:MAG: hypothetical protein CM15mP62_10390 [Rhodospirillaceae bacterium]
MPKGKQFTQKMLNSVEDFTHLRAVFGQQTKDLNRLVVELVHNYKIKANDLQGVLRREKFTIS